MFYACIHEDGPVSCEPQFFVKTADGALGVQDDLLHAMLLTVINKEHYKPLAESLAPPSLEDGDALKPCRPSCGPDAGAPDGLAPEQNEDMLGSVIQPVQLPVERDALAFNEHLPTDGKYRLELLPATCEANLKILHRSTGSGRPL